MLKHKNIIEKLNTLQKVAMISDFFGSLPKEISDEGIPGIKKTDLQSLNAESGEYPSFKSAACSWNTELFGLMSEELAARAVENGYNIISVPDLKTVVNPYKNGLSEDSYLNGAYGKAMLRAVQSAGAAACLAQLSIDESDVEYLDAEENEAAIYDLFVKPFIYAAEDSPCDAIECSLKKVNEGYGKTNFNLFGKAVHGFLGENALTVSDFTPANINLNSLLPGNVCMNGSALALENAIGRYNQLKERVREGGASQHDLNEEIGGGFAIGEDVLDETADKLIDFLYKLKNTEPPGKIGDSSETGLKLARESAVLLKNNQNLLPLKQGVKIAVIGDGSKYIPALSRQFEIAGSALNCFNGYEDSNIEALKAAAEAEVALVFLKTNPERNSLKAGENCLNVIKALKASEKPMTAVICGNFPLDISFDGCFSAILTVPDDCKYCGEVLADILSGKVNPSGKLTQAYYDYADDYFRKIKKDCANENIRIGSFTGYRFYDSAGKNVRYPFGYGLSYTRFNYSDLEIDGNNVSFLLSNTGSYDGAEVVQIYLGYPSESRVAPKKELKAFVKVFLKAGESKKITVNLPYSSYASYDADLKTENVEKGKYKIYVCSSVRETRLSGERKMSGVRRKKTEECPGDYFIGETNVKKDCRLSAATVNGGFGKSKLLAKTLTSALPVLLFLAFAIVSYILLSFILDYVLLTGIDLSMWKWIFFRLLACIIIAAVFTALFIIYLKIQIIKAKRDGSESLRPTIAQTETLNASLEDVFDLTPQSQPRVLSEIKKEAPRYFDKELDFASLFSDLKKFLSERGILADDGDLRNFLAALATSKLLVIPRAGGKNLKHFCRAVAEYFGKELFTDDAESYTGNQDLFFKTDGNSVNRLTGFGAAVEAALEDGEHMYFSLITNLSVKHLREILSPVTDFILFGQAENPVSGLPFKLPPNLRIIAEPEYECTPELLTGSISNSSAVFTPGLDECPISDSKSLTKTIGYYQFDKLVREAREKFSLSEEVWKLFDCFENAVKKAYSYRMDNRTYVKVEKHASVILACGGGEKEALTEAIAAYMLTGLSNVAQSGAAAPKITQIYEEIFGAAVGGYFDWFYGQNATANELKENGKSVWGNDNE